MIRASLKCEVFVCNEAVEMEVGAMKFTQMAGVGILKMIWKLENELSSLHGHL